MAAEEAATGSEEAEASAAQPADDDPAGLKALAGLEEQVRSSARWLIVAFAAVGALLVPALKTEEVGGLDGWRSWVAFGSVIVAAVMILVAVWTIVRFLSPGRTELAELAEREAADGADEVVAYFHRNTSLYQGQADSLRDLQKRYVQARERLADAVARTVRDRAPDAVKIAKAERDALTAVAERVTAVAQLHGAAGLTLSELAEAEGATPTPEDPSRAERALAYLREHPEFLGEARSVSDLRAQLVAAHEAVVAAEADAKAKEAKGGEALQVTRYRLGTIEHPIAQIEAVAAYQDLRLPFLRWRWLVALAAASIALAMGAFAYATSPPEEPRNDLSGRTFDGLDLSGANLSGADLSDTTFRNSNLEGTDLDDADLDGTRFEKTTCPSGLSSQVVGNRCRRHLKVRPSKPGPKKPTGRVPGRAEPGRG